MRALDEINRKIIRELQLNARIPNVLLAERVGLSPSACLRRLHLLEHSGAIRGYTALLGCEEPDRPTIVLVQITLEKQTGDALKRFEEAVRKCPHVEECSLMSGTSDYFLRVLAKDAADYERIHDEQLSRLPGVDRIQSSFVIRAVVRPGSRFPLNGPLNGVAAPGADLSPSNGLETNHP